MGADSIMEVIDVAPQARFKKGDLVQGWGGWQTYVISNGKEKHWQTGTFPMVFPAYRQLNIDDYSNEVPISTALGVLGGPGMTAWGTLTKFFDIKENNTLMISGASGAIGELLGQLAKLQGARVVGTAGSQAKIDHLKNIGFDEVINYKENNTPETISQALQTAAPNGIDHYFDNIGGDITDAVFPLLNLYSQVAICWQWAVQVNKEYAGPRILPYIMFPRTTIRGIYALEWFDDDNWRALIDTIGNHIIGGKIKINERVYQGFDAVPEAYQSLFTGSENNRGKVLIKI